MTVEPKARIPPPQGNGESSETLAGGAGGVLIADPLGDRIPPPMEQTTCFMSWPKPPKVSATMGRKSTPVDLQAEKWTASLHWAPTCKAWLRVEAAS